MAKRITKQQRTDLEKLYVAYVKATSKTRRETWRTPESIYKAMQAIKRAQVPFYDPNWSADRVRIGSFTVSKEALGMGTHTPYKFKVIPLPELAGATIVEASVNEEGLALTLRLADGRTFTASAGGTEMAWLYFGIEGGQQYELGG